MATLSRTPQPVPPVNTRILDAFWRPEGAPPAAPQTGMVAAAGIGGNPAWAFTGVATRLADGGMVAEVAAAAGTIMSMSTIGCAAVAKVNRSQVTIADPDLLPIYRYLVRFRREVVGGAPGTGCGIELREAAAAVGATVGPGTNAGIAFVMDGAGGWQVIARQVIGGPLTMQVPVAWPNGDQQYTTWEMRITPPTPVQDAVFSLLANGALILTREWSVGPLPDYSGAGAHYRFIPTVVFQPAGPTDHLLVQSTRIIIASTLD